MRYILTSVLCGLALLAGCHHHKPAVQSHGLEVITVAPAYDRARRHRRRPGPQPGRLITNADGSRSDPTYNAGSQTTKTGQGDQTKTACTRAYLEFQTKNSAPSASKPSTSPKNPSSSSSKPNPTKPPPRSTTPS